MSLRAVVGACVLLGGVVSCMVGASVGSPEPLYQEICPSHNNSLADELDSVLGQMVYVHEYEYGVFDCSDTSINAQKYLRSLGYDAYVVAMLRPRPQVSHMWVVVRDPVDGAYLTIETTIDMQHTLGRVIRQGAPEARFYARGVVGKDPLRLLGTLGFEDEMVGRTFGDSAIQPVG